MAMKISLDETMESFQRSSPVDDSPVYGRENEKNSIIGFLLSDDFNRNNLTVVCMVGESGIGKTSLAHLIYSEERILDSFDARMFITMPEKSDETRLMKKLFESVTSSPCPMTEEDLLEELLIDELSGTKVFVVLDDADNENPFFWDRIVTILNHSARGSILLVTTKSKDVAEVMGAMQTYSLDPLSDNYCWKLFWQHIFTGLNTNANTDLVETGKKLVSKCQHNPLCIKVLTGLLVCLKNVGSWVEILKTDLLNMDGFDGDTLPILRVCYETLPDNLKKCLHYCSLFPKDYVFAKQQIVRMWMSQGFIVSVEGRQPEEVGLQNFDELLLRGFFQHSPLHDVEEDKYIMHDLIRALATHFSRNESASTEDAVERILENCFHFSLDPSVIQIDKMKPLIKEASDLQSFLLLTRLQTRINISILDITSLSDLFTKCINLRTLDLSCTDIVELPSSVGMLKQLRYLGVNNTKIRSIPRELCSLVSLQTLEAKDCQHLVELPESMMELTNLRHLDVSRKSGCVKMMIGIGQLTNLQSLAVFCVGCEMPYCSIRELKDLNCLSSCLQIAGLENITYGLDAKEAALHNKVHLNTLWLHWNDNRTCIESEESVTISEEVLKNLKPNPNIGELIIRNYRGNLFPTWMGDPSFSKLVSIILDKCLNCSQFPALGGLPSLRHLSVQKLYHLVRLENTDSQFVLKNTPKFPSLETLNLWEMYDLEELFETSDCDFPCLHTLSISRCPMLKTVPCFSSLLNLSLYCCVKLPYLPDFPLLKSLRIDGFQKIKSLELPKDLPALKELEIRHCNELILVEGLPNLPSLEKLNVVHCPNFDSFKNWKPCHSKPISTTRCRSPLPPRPPLKRKLSSEFSEAASSISTASDSGVQVIVRIRPPSKDEEEEGSIVQKLSGNSVSISDHTFTFDSVADTGCSQEDVFHLVGLPLVENCLAGFNSSIFAYGQTGSGKTYTMWGPAAALSDENLLNCERGLTPRVFELLFSRINEEQIKHSNKELTYNCTCSFLEIYNEQITDLLDPTQRNLQIREDVGTGVYVESLTEEFAYTLKDVTQLLMKGLANRRTGATSVNLESSRSHCVFTCVIRSQFKNVEDGLNAARISRINLVDLAGSERQKLTKAAGDRLKEAGNINKSLSQLGNLINILGEVSQSGKQRHVPYRDSKLTFLLQESLGGNAKLAMICAVSPSARCKSETLSTLRFAQCAKAIKNKAVVNETTQDDVNVLREQVRLLRDELVRIKSNKGATNADGYSTAVDARRTLNLLRMSLTCTTAMPSIKDDSDEEMEIDENDVEKPSKTSQESLDSSSNGEPTGTVLSSGSIERKSSSLKSPSHNKLSIVPEISNSSLSESQTRKSPRTSSTISPSHRAIEESTEAATSALDIPLLPNRKAESLAASINRGLHVFDNGPKKNNNALRRASFSFFVRPSSPEPPSAMESVPVPSSLQVKPVCQVDAGTQTIPEELEEVMNDDSSVSASGDDSLATDQDPSLDLVPADAPLPTEKSKMQKVPKAVKKLLAGSIRREMELEALNARQAAEIQQLNRLVQHYKHERECSAVIAQTREDKISRLETLMDGILPVEEFMEEEFLALQNEHKHLRSVYDNHPEVLRINIELKRAQEELDKYQNFYELGEREVLMEEIEDLKTQLNYYLTCPSASFRFRNPVPLPIGPLSTIPEQEVQENDTKRESWSESEGKWITLTKELEMELDSNRNKAEQLRVELDSERCCTEELKEALQMAMQGHARILEQYADLQEKHMSLLAKNRKISDGVEDVKKAAAKAGVSRPESKFINSLAAEVSVLRVEREKERRYWRDENRGLQAQLRDMAEAVQAAGEVVVRLKEAEETAKRAQKRARVAEQETEKVYQEMENLKKNYDKQIFELNQIQAESALPKDALENTPEKEETPSNVAAKYDASDSLSDQRWRKEFEPFGIDGSGEVSEGTDPNSWFLDYDRCNI